MAVFETFTPACTYLHISPQGRGEKTAKNLLSNRSGCCTAVCFCIVDLIPEPEQVPVCDADGNQSEPDSSVIDSMENAGEILLIVSAGQK